MRGSSTKRRPNAWRDQVEARKQKSVEFMRRLGKTAAADKLERESVEDYATRKGINLENSGRRKNWLHPKDLKGRLRIRRWYIDNDLPLPQRFWTPADQRRWRESGKKFTAELRAKRKAFREQQRRQRAGKVIMFPGPRNPRRRNYFEERIPSGSRVAVITANTEAGPFSTRVYVDQGRTATLTVKKAKTLAGARKQAREMLAKFGGPGGTPAFRVFRNPKPVTAYLVVPGRTTQQEWYESKSGDARTRAAQLRKLGFKVSVSPMGSQITPAGRVNMTLLTVYHRSDDIPAPDKVARMNPALRRNLQGRPPLSEKESRKMWAKYAPYFEYLSSKGAPGGGRRRSRRRNIKYKDIPAVPSAMGGGGVVRQYHHAGATIQEQGPGRWKALGSTWRSPTMSSRRAAERYAEMFAQKNARRNFGQGRQFQFHGSFAEKSVAREKEKQVPGSFIKTFWYKSGPRYAVVTRRKNARARGRRKNQYARSPAVARKRVAIKRKLRAAGYSFSPDLSYRELAKLVMQAKRDGRWGKAKNVEWPKTGTIVDEIRHGDRVTIVDRFGQQRTGKAVMLRGDGQGWVLNMGGAHGTPGLAGPDNTVRVKKSSRRNRRNSVDWGTKGDTSYFREALKEVAPGKKVEELTQAELSKVICEAQKKKAEAKKSGKHNPKRRRAARPRRRRKNSVVPVPGGFRSFERGRISPIFRSRRDAQLWAGARMNPRQLHQLRRRRNQESADKLYEDFHGMPPGEHMYVEDLADHPELAKLGDLVLLRVRPKKGEEYEINWKTKQPIVAAEPSGSQIFFVGGDQDLSQSVEEMELDETKDMLDLGECTRIEYAARKAFDGFEPVVYFHVLGEETGVRPRLMYDQPQLRLFLVGGEYHVKPEGVVN